MLLTSFRVNFSLPHALVCCVNVFDSHLLHQSLQSFSDVLRHEVWSQGEANSTPLLTEDEFPFKQWVLFGGCRIHSIQVTATVVLTLAEQTYMFVPVRLYLLLENRRNETRRKGDAKQYLDLHSPFSPPPTRSGCRHVQSESLPAKQRANKDDDRGSRCELCAI
jgi:hypothetical protein